MKVIGERASKQGSVARSIFPDYEKAEKQASRDCVTIMDSASI